MKPSEVAAAACLVAGKQCSCFSWNDTMEHYTGFTELSLKNCAEKIYNAIRRCNRPEASLTAVRRKYTHMRHQEVALMDLISMNFV